jgi:hypothetical protein
MSRVFIFSRDPGGANTVIPLVKPLLERNHEVLLYGKDVALSKYHQQGLTGIDITTAVSTDDADVDLRKLLKELNPDFVITGTSADDFTEKCLWKICDELTIPSMAIQDQWLNYGIRFSPYTVHEIADYAANPVHPFLPARIIAPDEHAKSEMIADGLPEERIVICGQPHFETVLATKNELASGETLNQLHGLSSDDFVIVFASEPITKTFGEGGLKYWGYTEITILTALLQALDAAAGELGREVTLIVRPHPKEGHEHFADILKRCWHVRCIIDSTSLPWTLMNRADLVCGMSSMFLIESVILGRPILSIQIGLCRENPFILDRRGSIKSILTAKELRKQINKLLTNCQSFDYSFDVIRNPTERIIAEMEKLLCQTSQ